MRENRQSQWNTAENNLRKVMLFSKGHPFSMYAKSSEKVKFFPPDIHT